ncbi:E3 ubiquitin-protein ligase TRIM71 [Geodia barretti]|uniref:E3 ubiquitin-protein ligase TRIM71 n=1 Tax=Geodia barretti TaxID=519541 RepID=A0AA35T9V3_GEOBA|nr:E3 ubiquitin-protein ligase TRIM71 [Geodia barretti]
MTMKVHVEVYNKFTTGCGEYNVKYSLPLQHPSLAIVKAAGLIMKAIIEEGTPEMAKKMQDLALAEGALPRHLHTSLFTASSDNRLLTHRSGVNSRPHPLSTCKIQDQVTCGICLEPYKQPRLLKCFHVYCEQCLQRLRCKEIHQNWDELKTHEFIDLDTLTGDVTTLIPSLKKTLFCATHPSKEADLYCETCDELICRDCIVRVHRDHQYDLVPESFAKQEKVIVDSLKPVEEQIATLEIAVESVNTQCALVVERKTAAVAEIRTAMAHLRQALEARETELVGQAEQTAQQKLKTLAAQRDGFELQLGQLRSCQDFVEESQRTCSQGEILRTKSPLVKQLNDLTGSFKPETLALAEQADMKFAHNLPELVKTCQQFGKVYCHPVCPKKCRTSGEGIKVAMRGQTAAVSVEALDREGEACLKHVDSLRCELVASDGSSRVRSTVKRRNQNIYDISYLPQVTGEHQLHILIEEHPTLNSPFTVTVLPNFTAPTNITGDLNAPYGIAVREGGEVVVAERSSNCISIISGNGEKKSFGTSGSGPGQFDWPEGIAIDNGGSILVADYGNHRIQQLSSTGKHLRTVGTRGSGPLQFQSPVGITVHPHTGKVYVADCHNHRIQVLNSDLTYSSSFGRKGSNNGEFSWPYDVSTDGDGNVYVADKYNHRIQVFTVNGVYLKQFGKKGEGEGELNDPVTIAIDSGNVVYVSERGNNRISIFSTDGEFIKSVGRQGKGPVEFDHPFGLAIDKKGTVYVSDFGNHRIQIFT